MSEFTAGDMADAAAKGFAARDAEVAKLIEQRDELEQHNAILLKALKRIVTSWEEGQAFSDKMNEIGNARAAITNATTTERK